MTPLVPEKRPDKNGRMVTRHVRPDSGAPTKKPTLPAVPALGRAEGQASEASPKPPKLRAAQRQQKPMSILWQKTGRTPSREFWGDGESFDYCFTASEGEAYEVASVCADEGDAAKLLSLGVRTAEGARDYLQSQGLGHLIEDRAEVMQAVLAQGVRFEDLVKSPQILREAYPIEARVGALRFGASSLGSVPRASTVQAQVLRGRIDFEDIRAVGIGRLKDHGMILHFAPLLEKTRAGTEGFAVESLRALVVRIDEEAGAGVKFPGVVALANLISPDEVLSLPSLRAAGEAYEAMSLRGDLYRRDASEMALYLARFMAAVGREPSAGREAYKAGVPLETAIAVHRSGGSAEQAAAAHRDGVDAPLADGYL